MGRPASLSSGESQGSTDPASQDREDGPPGPVFQGALAASFECSGNGLHTGKRATVRVHPAPAGHGVVFRRTVGRDAHDVAAIWTNRRSRPLCTALQSGDGPLVRTVEHLMAALAAYAIDNALIEIDGEEVPILDGSAEPWCALIDEAGRAELSAPRQYVKIVRRVRHRTDRRNKLKIEPAARTSVMAEITLQRFGRIRWDGALDGPTFRRELAAARSFGRVKWAAFGMLAGLFSREPILRGANHRNTAALWRDTAIGGLRFPDEPVRHRALDLIGDLALAGAPIVGRIEALRPGHEHNFALLEALMSDPRNYRIVTYDAAGRMSDIRF